MVVITVVGGARAALRFVVAIRDKFPAPGKIDNRAGTGSLFDRRLEKGDGRPFSSCPREMPIGRCPGFFEEPARRILSSRY